jgi:hypothetical protein
MSGPRGHELLRVVSAARSNTALFSDGIVGETRVIEMVVHPEEMTSARRIADCTIVGRGIFYLVLSFAGRLAQAFACDLGFEGVESELFEHQI